MNWIDTHAHMYDEQFIENIDLFVQQAVAQNVNEIYLPNCDQFTIPAMMQITEQFPNVFKPMMGLHPCYVKENVQEELAIVKKWLEQYDFAAVGEIGLDYYWDVTFKEQQKQAFAQQIVWAKEKSLPIIIHTRESIDDGIAIVKEHQDGQLKGIFHCFSGNLEQAKAIVDLGFLLGIGGVVTYKKSDLVSLLENIDLKDIVLETDAPYLAPVPYRGKRNESAYTPLVGEKVAQIKKVPLSEVASITTANAKALFKY